MMLPAIFADCVCKIETRYAITAPWLADGMVYATNGHIIVRCPHTPAIGDVPPVENTPPVAPLFVGKTWPVKLELGELPPPLAQVKCEECKGTGKASMTCKGCNGACEVECDMGHYHDCKECKGRGVMPGDGKSCDDCNGTGLEDAPPRPFRVSATQCLGECYARLLVKHGAVMYATDRGGNDPFRFTVGDVVEGLVMPMSPDHQGNAVDVRGGA